MSLVSKTAAIAASAARCTRGSKVVRTCTSSVVLRVRKSGPEDITQSAKDAAGAGGGRRREHRRARARLVGLRGGEVALLRHQPDDRLARACARARSPVGAKREGARRSPASIAASAGFTCAADLPK